MGLEIVLSLIGIALALGEFYVWYSEILWHKSESKNTDRRNWTP